MIKNTLYFSFSTTHNKDVIEHCERAGAIKQRHFSRNRGGALIFRGGRILPKGTHFATFAMFRFVQV